MKVPSQNTKIGDRVRECYETSLFGPRIDLFTSFVKAFDGETGEAYISPHSEITGTLLGCRRIRSWVRCR